MKTPERHEFQAEVKELLGLVVHSLYSNKDIFLRELVSNASDALDKLRFEQITRPELASGELEIRIDVDREKRTLSIVDNGIGMTRDEVVRNIGTIARSGTKEFVAALKASDKKELPPELIGQFGVGFYSAFMVADRVELVTRRAGEASATSWDSTGDGSYSVGDGERATQGTTVTLYLKPVDSEQGLHDYTRAEVIRDIVKRYSDFVGYPIRTKTWKKSGEGAAATQVLEDETLNSRKAIWDRPKAEVTESEYHEFYHHISHDWASPLRTLPVRIEGTLEAYALLYLPAKAPLDLYSPEMKRGLQLYVKRVFVMDECRDLMPPHLRFVRGVVDAHDLSLNVSREILQKDRQIQIIRKQLVRKVLGTLDEMKKDEPGEYRRFWEEFGPVLKEGLVAYDVDHKDRLLDLVVTRSTAKPDETTSLADYVSRMKEGQDAIYFLTGPTRDAVARSPLLEAFKAKDYEVLLFSDPIDEIWLERAPHYKDKALVSIGRGEVKLGSDDERKREEAALDEKKKEYGDLLTCLRVRLQEQVKEVRLSNRLTSSPVCLVAGEHDLSPRVQKMLEQLGQEAPKTKRILELNPTHALVTKLQGIFRENKDDPRLGLYADLLLGQAHLAESGELPDPAAFSRAVAELMERAS
jgi:molecular chaperone HtpG